MYVCIYNIVWNLNGQNRLNLKKYIFANHRRDNSGSQSRSMHIREGVKVEAKKKIISAFNFLKLGINSKELNFVVIIPIYYV